MKLTWTQLPSIPDAEGFASPFAGVSGGALLVGGGANFPGKRPWEGGVKIWYDTVFALSAPDGRWQVAGKLPRPCGYGVAVTHGGGVVCAGGGDAREHHSDVYKLTWNPTTPALAIEALPSLPKPCSNACGALLGDVFYMAGGIERPDSTQAMHTFWALDLSKPSDGWREMPAWPGSGRMLSAAGVSGGEFFIFSGVSLHADASGKSVRDPLLKDCYAYNPARGTWRRIADMSPRVAAAAPTPAPVTADGRLLLCTGDDGTRVHLNGPAHPGFTQDVLAYDPAADRWEIAGECAFSRATVPTAEWGGRCVIVNGERRPGYRSPEVWALEAV